jgi:hypothetical protein
LELRGKRSSALRLEAAHEIEWGLQMIPICERRRKFLGGFSGLCIAIAPLTLLPANLHARQDQGSRPISDPEPKPRENDTSLPPGSRKAALEENERGIKKKVEKLFQLASELRDEVDKTDSVKVLSLAMVKKAEEIEKLAKDIKTKARG